MEARHRQEQKDLQAQIQSIKKGAPKGDKKRKKESQIEIAKLEQELEERQQLEIKGLDENGHHKEELNVKQIIAETEDNQVLKKGRQQLRKVDEKFDISPFTNALCDRSGRLWKWNRCKPKQLLKHLVAMIIRKRKKRRLQIFWNLWNYKFATSHPTDTVCTMPLVASLPP